MGGVVSVENWFDSATSIVVSEVELLPIEEAQKKWGEGLARIDSRDFVIDIDLGAVRRIVAAGIRGLNGEYAEAVLSFSNVAVGDDEEGSEFVSYGDSGPNVANDWIDTFGTALWWTGAAKFARYVRIAVNMTSSVSPDTWTDIRRIWIGGGYAVDEGVDAGWQLDFVDGSTADRGPQGAVFATPGATWRRLRLAITNRPESAAFGIYNRNTGPLWVMLAKVGRGAEVVVAPRGPDTAWYYGQVIHGQLVEWSPLAFLPGSLVSMESATFEEVPLEALS